MHSWPAPDLPARPGSFPALRLYDHASDSVRETEAEGPARMYVCGITPYDATHLGHAATYVTFDLVHRYWRAAGREVRYVQNVTDVDDPLFERAQRDGVDWRDLGREQTDLFRADMTALRVLPPSDYVGAVETMGEVADAVAELLASGAAYRVDDAAHPDVYFDVATGGRFGYESRYDVSQMLRLAAERGGDPDRAGKRNPLDPLLWRMARDGEPSWPAPFGAGRAGWHIECAVIAINRLGGTIDLQGGGSDLVFPHHECSAAHAEALTGRHPFAGHYTHTGMMLLDGEKMSKSLGNLEFVSRLTAAGTDPMVIRLALLDGRYREDRPWRPEALAAAARRLDSWSHAATRAGTDPSAAREELRRALADDLDTPRALAAVDGWAADDRLDGADMAAEVDALLGVRLRQ